MIDFYTNRLRTPRVNLGDLNPSSRLDLMESAQSSRPETHPISIDLKNFMSHWNKSTQENLSQVDRTEKLFIYKPKELPSDSWNDQHILEKFNKTS